MPCTNYLKEKEEEVKIVNKKKKKNQFQVGNEGIIFSPCRGKKRYMYVLRNFNFLEYKPYRLNVLIDSSRATISNCRWSALHFPFAFFFFFFFLSECSSFRKTNVNES